MTVDVTAGQQVNLDTIDGNGDGLADNGIGVPRWFGWLDGYVYNDANGNGLRDPGEPPIPNTDVDERWRDGSIKEATMTDASGHYSYTEAEGGPLGKWFIGEVGFSRFLTTGASTLPDKAYNTTTPPPTVAFGTEGEGGGLLTNQIMNVGHHQDVDWGKQTYAEGQTGQIVGVVYHGTTRNEVNAYQQGHEDYEPGIPGVKVLLKKPNGEILGDYTTDHWAPPTSCEVRNSTADLMDPLSPTLPFNALIPSHCIESPLLSGQTKDGAFDGGYAFADKCPDDNAGHSTYPCDDAQKVPLTPGKYVTQVLMPEDSDGNPLYQITKEEDVNVDNGPDFTPQTPGVPVRRRRPRRQRCDPAGQDERQAPQALRPAPGHAEGQAERERRLLHLHGERHPDPRSRDRPGHERRRDRQRPAVPLVAEQAARERADRHLRPRSGRRRPPDQDDRERRDGPVRRDAAVHRDDELPDARGHLPRHVLVPGQRPRHEGAPEQELQPEPDHRGDGLVGLAGHDLAARHARDRHLRGRRL